MIEKAGAWFPTQRDHFRWFHCCLGTGITSGSRSPPLECSSISEKQHLWKVKGINGVLAMSIRNSEGIIASHAWCCRQLSRGSESVYCKEGGEHQSICVLTRWPTISSRFFFSGNIFYLAGGEGTYSYYIAQRFWCRWREKRREKIVRCRNAGNKAARDTTIEKLLHKINCIISFKPLSQPLPLLWSSNTRKSASYRG